MVNPEIRSATGQRRGERRPLSAANRQGDTVAVNGCGRPFGRPARRCSQILSRPRRDLPEFLRGVKGPVGIAQHLARQQHEVGLIVADDLVGLGRPGDHADRSGGDIRFAANSLSERRLVPRPDRDLRLLDIAARRAIDHIDAKSEQLARKLDRLVDVPSALDPVGRREADEQRAALRQDAPHRSDAFADESRAVVERAAVSVGAAVAERRQKLVDQISVRAVNLDHPEAGGERALSRDGEGTMHSMNLVDRHFIRHGVGIIERDGARRERAPSARRLGNGAIPRPGPIRAGLPAGMGQLNAGASALSVKKACDPFERLEMLLAPDAEVLG